MFSLSSIRDDPLPKRPTPSLLHSCDPSISAPKSAFSSIAFMPVTQLSCTSIPKHPIYTSSDPQVIDVLNECSDSSDPCLLLSNRPRWVLVLAALSTYYHPSHPAHLAFWRPEIMNETGEMIDKFLKTKEAKYLESRHGWIDAEISLYTLKGYQRGHYPDLYSPNITTRILRKRKAGMIAPSHSDEPDGLLDDDEVRSTTRARRTTRSTTAKKISSMEKELESNLTTTIEDDPPPHDLTQSTDTKPRPKNNRPGGQRGSSSGDVSTVSSFKGHRRRSSSMTSSGLSLSNSVTTTDTLVDEDMQNDEDTRSVASADTVIEGIFALKGPVDDDANITSASMAKLALLVDLATASVGSPLTTPPLSPPPSRRSKRAVRLPKRQLDMDDKEKEMVCKRPRTRLSTGSTFTTAARRKKRVKRF